MVREKHYGHKLAFNPTFTLWSQTRIQSNLHTMVPDSTLASRAYAAHSPDTVFFSSANALNMSTNDAT